MLPGADERLSPFLMAVESFFYFPSRTGAEVHGPVLRGTLKVGDAVEIVGLRPAIKSCLYTGVPLLNFLTLEAHEEFYRDGRQSILVRGVIEGDLERGQVIAAARSIRPYATFKATLLSSLVQANIPLRWAAAPAPMRLQLWGREMAGRVGIPEGSCSRMETEPGEFTMTLSRPVALEVGLSFTFEVEGAPDERYTGRVTDLLES